MHDQFFVISIHQTAKIVGAGQREQLDGSSALFDTICRAHLDRVGWSSAVLDYLAADQAIPPFSNARHPASEHSGCLLPFIRLDDRRSIQQLA